MAFQWRIRYKLMLGLGLVVVIIALLLAGTLYGLVSYRATMKSIESKLAELREAEAFKASVTELPNFKTPDGLVGGVAEAGKVLEAYELRLEETLKHHRDPDKGFQEKGLVDVLRDELVKLRTGAEKSKEPKAFRPGEGGSLMEDPDIKKAIGDLVRDSGDLRYAIYDDLDRRNKDAKVYSRTTLWIVFSVSIFGVMLLCGLLRFFYGWVFYPIRDLEQGAGRVAQGDFEHRIEVHSGDEMEDLAAAFNDMTGRLREMYRDLARQVNERSRQLVRSERLAGVGFLAAGVAHEINNPLASIAFCSEALEQRLTSLLKGARHPGGAGNNGNRPGEFQKDSEVVTKYLKMIQEEAFRCKAITERLLEFSRGGERRREPTDLAGLIQGVLEVVQHLQNCKGKHIVFEPVEHLVAWVNAQEIKSVVLNLVVNALDSMEDGGTLTITLSQRDGMAEMVFADTGCGMSAEILENIFEPFFTRSRTGKGTGLGLSISHRVISQHGGEIEAVSPGPNQGSTFTVRLSVQPADAVKEDTLGHAAA